MIILYPLLYWNIITTGNLQNNIEVDSLTMLSVSALAPQDSNNSNSRSDFPSSPTHPPTMPTHSPRSANRPRRHNKTFTGCWTCRARKVKCDEGRPICCQCRQRGIPCGGYGIRLQWMAPGTGLEDDGQGVGNQPVLTGSCRRRLMSGLFLPTISVNCIGNNCCR